MTTFDHLDRLAAQVREDLAAKREAAEIAQDLDLIAEDHYRSLHPSNYQPTKTLDELAIGDWIRVADEWVQVQVIRPSVLTVRRERSCMEWEYPVTEGEAFVFGGAPF